MELGGKNLKVVRASIGSVQAAGLDMGVQAMSVFANTRSQDLEAGRVLQLLNMVTAEELMDDEDYQGKVLIIFSIPDLILTLSTEILEDVRDECEKYGGVLEIKVPRPSGGSRQSPGVGKIYVKFDNTEAATKALKALAGRKFSDRTVVTSYFSEVFIPRPSAVRCDF